MSVPHGVPIASEGRPPRRFIRQRIDTLVYANLGPDNGGFPIDISENGMAFQGVLPLEPSQSLTITFKLPGVEKTVTSSAEIIWLNESRKGGGLQFIDLSEDSRHTVHSWLSLRERSEKPTGEPIDTVHGSQAQESARFSEILWFTDGVSAGRVRAIADPHPVMSTSATEATKETVKMVRPMFSSIFAPLEPLRDAENESNTGSFEVGPVKHGYRIRVVLPNEENKRVWTTLYKSVLVIFVLVTVLGGGVAIRYRSTGRPVAANGESVRPKIQAENPPISEPVPEQRPSAESPATRENQRPETGPVASGPVQQSASPDATK